MEGIQGGSWEGKRAFLIGGGPSLRDFDFSRLNGELTLGLNMAFLHNPTANLIFDFRLMARLYTDQRWLGYRGEKFWLNYEVPHHHCYPGVRVLHECLDSNRRYPRWSRNLSEGLWRKTNAGASALNLAEILGADPIYLLGFDFKGENGKAANYHSEYPESWAIEEKMLQTYMQDFELNVGNIHARVINLNPDSELKCFEFGDLDLVLPKQEAKA